MVAEPIAAEMRRRYFEPRERLGLLPGEVDARGGDGLPTLKQIAIAFGVSEHTVWRAVRERDSERSYSPGLGHRLTPAERAAVDDALRAGVPHVVIAEAFRLNRGSVWLYARRLGLPPRRGRAGVKSGITAATYLASLQSTPPAGAARGDADSWPPEARSAAEGHSAHQSTSLRGSGGQR